MTVKAVALGLLLAFVFGAANAYLGMRAGQTVAATIPAFVLVEINGVRLWRDLRAHYWEATFILLAGGLIGVFFIILLRRPLCVDAGLPWPESVASVEIVKAGDRAGAASRYIFGAMGVGGLIQILKSDKGFPVFRDYIEGFLAFPRSVIRHFDFEKRPIGDVAHAGGIAWSTPSLSPALLGIGYIIGPELASINVAGGIMAWWLFIPLLLFFDPDLPRRLGNASPDVAAYTLWYNVVRPVAVGAMLVAAFHTLFSMRASIARSLKGAFSASSAAARGHAAAERTERDIPAQWVVAGILTLLIPITAIYFFFTHGWLAAIVSALVMTVTGFLLSAVGGYLVGLVGSSNQPVSGLTLSALVIAALVLLAIGVKGAAGVAAVLGVAAVVCCACCVSGSLIQDLKAGHLLGGTPWKMQVVEIVAVAMLSFFLMGPIIVLHEANLATGGIGGRALPAPQAGLMAQLAKGIVGGEMAWGLLGIGAAFGAALILCGARAPMLIAVGMYLPFDTSSAIFAGGLLKALASRISAGFSPEEKGRVEEKGTLVASGLIAGEAIVGILLAVLFVSGAPSLAALVIGSGQPGFYARWGSWLSILGFASLAYLLVRVPARRS
jgi:OPT family oligopeptide transporter